MMKALTVTNPKGEKLRLELSRPELSGLAIQSIEGIGMPKASINATELATTDGSYFSSTRVGNRNIVITLAMLFSPTIELSRIKAYRFFPVKKKISLLFETDTRIAEITGYVESNDPVIFSNAETTQISIICTDPYFYALGISETVFSGVRPSFEFPFSNESLTEKMLEFGEIRLDNRAVLNYIGDSDTGLLITIHFLGKATEIAIFNTETSEAIRLDTAKIEAISGGPLDLTDDIIISTMKGQKYVRLLRDGKYTNVIGAVEKDMDWFQLSNGANVFAFSAKTGEKNLIVTFTYRNAYGGI